MKISKKGPLIQISYILKTHGAAALVTYFINAFHYRVVNIYIRGSYSQKGEDLIIDKFFKHKKNGFYIDIGAFHPKRLSNTKFFYDKGWHGINIEPNPENLKLFLKERKRDVNLSIGIGNSQKMAIFYELEPPALSTFSKEEANSLSKLGYRIKREIKISMSTLEEIMKKYVKSSIDFITVDTEGLDIDVLKSNNWNKYRPRLLCIETKDFIDQLINKQEKEDRKKTISNYLAKVGYKEYFSNGLNTLYVDTI